MSTDYEPPPDDLLFMDEETAAESGRPVGTPYRHAIDVTTDARPANRDLNYLVPLLERVVTALETLAQNASRPPSAPPGAAVPPPAQGMPPKASNGPDTTKMGKKVYAVCRTQGWDVKEIGEQILGRPVNPNSQKWPFEDLRVVLDQFTEWNV